MTEVPEEPDRQHVDRSTVYGSVTQIGQVAGNATIYASPVVKSAYLEQVRRIAPPGLIAREEELADLARFCGGRHTVPYRWWRAPAWAGKSALMSWFVLHPPPGVEIVSFFVTARFASQNDRAAFLDVVIEQLADLLGQGMPAGLAPATREAHLRRMLTEATRAARTRGNRLVLLVDGLDEDRGVTVGPDAYSIAALLPADPEPGMSVVVAGRPQPPIPTDVPDDHPLRDPGIVRGLTASEYAKTVRADAERELKRLLHGTPIERSLLGFVVAAGGGLSGPDLAALTGVSVREVEDHLRAVTGRTFTTRTEVWRADSGRWIYVLGHEDLQELATDHLAGPAIESYVDRLNAWADTYAAAGWPVGTPEYLLRGYSRMLRKRRDAARLVRLATDQLRHDRMLDISGGDSAALEEIAAAQDLVLDEDGELAVIARLAVHRKYLADRNKNIPTQLPAVWGTLGYPVRAEALALSIGDPVRKAGALSRLAACDEAVAHLTDNTEMLSALRGALDRIGDDDERLRALAEAARAFNDTGHGSLARGFVEQAAALARAMPDADRKLAEVAVLAAELDLPRFALTLADEVADESGFGALTALVGPFATARRGPELAELLARIEKSLPRAGWYAGMRLLQTLLGAGLDVHAAAASHAVLKKLPAGMTSADRDEDLVDFVGILGSAGEFDRAEDLLPKIGARYKHSRATAELAVACATQGQVGRAVRLAGGIGDPARRGTALVEILEVAAQQASPVDEALAVLIAAVRAVDRACVRTELLAKAAGCLARTGDLPGAGNLLDMASVELSAIDDPDEATFAFCLLVRVNAHLEPGDGLGVLIAQGERRAREINNHIAASRAFDALANAAIAVGAYADAARLSAPVTSTALGTATMTRLVRVMARDGHHADAVRHVGTIGDPRLGDALRRAICRSLAAAGKVEDAVEVAELIEDFTTRGEVMSHLAWMAARAGETELATELATTVETRARLLIDPGQRVRTVESLAEALAPLGDFGRATTLALELPAQHRDNLLGTLAARCTDGGDLEAAVRLTSLMDAGGPRFSAQRKVMSAAVAAGRYDLAQHIAAGNGLIKEPAGNFIACVAELGAAGHRAALGTVVAQVGDPFQQTALWRAFLRAAAESTDRGLRSALVPAAQRWIGTWTNPLRRAEALVELVRAGGDALPGEAAEALVSRAGEDIGLVKDLHERSAVLLELANVLVALGRRAAAGLVVRQLMPVIGELELSVRENRLLGVVGVHAALQQLREAAEAAEHIEDAVTHDRALALLVVAAIRQTDVVYAEAVASRLADPYQRVLAVRAGLQALRLAGHAWPDRLVDFAVAGLDKVLSRDDRIGLLCGLARESSLAGYQQRADDLVQRAVRTADDAPSTAARATLVVDIIRAAGDILESSADLDRLTEYAIESTYDDDEIDRDDLRTELSSAIATHGLHQRAYAVLGSAEPSSAINQVLADLVKRSFAAGEAGVGFAALGEISDADDRFAAALTLIGAAARDGTAPDVLEKLHVIAFDAIEQPSEYDHSGYYDWLALLRVAGSCEEHRHAIVEAVMADGIIPTDRAQSWQIICRLLTTLAPWDLRRALALVEAIDAAEPVLWTAVAAGMPAADSIDVRRTLGHALCTAEWPDMIATMARVRPDLIAVVAKEFESLAGAERDR